MEINNEWSQTNNLLGVWFQGSLITSRKRKMENNTEHLTKAQTTELREIWDLQKNAMSTKDWLFVKVKLGKDAANFTNRQLFRLTMNLAESGFESIPTWLVSLISLR